MNDMTGPAVHERNPLISAAEKTLADVVAELQQDTILIPTRRRDLISAVRRMAKLLNRDPAMVPARISAIHNEIDQLHPLTAGVSKKSIQNIKSDTLVAFRHLGICQSTRHMADQLSPPWQLLRAALPDRNMRRGLSRFMRYCDFAGIAPDDVNDAVVGEFMDAIAEATFVKAPYKLRRQVIRLWNTAAAEVAGWPSLVLTMPPSKKQRQSYPLETFPPSFQADVEAYLQWLEGKDLFADHLPPKPCKPSTIKQRRQYILLAASALVHRGKAIDGIKGLADLLAPTSLKEISRYYMEKNEGEITSFLRCLCNALLQIARSWLRVDEAQLTEIQQVRRRLGSNPEGLTEKNKAMLRQFDDPAVTARLLRLPEQLVAAAQKRDHNWRTVATMQSALALEIFLMAPMRIANLVGLRLDQHVIRTGKHYDKVHLVLPEHEVKNARSADYELPSHLIAMLDLYLNEYRCRDAAPDNPYLFHGKTRPQKTAGTLKQTLVTTIYRHTGIVMTPHQFRHLAAKIVLDANPANFELARRILGHRNIRTTVNFYAGLDSNRAFKHYDETVMELRKALTS